MLMQSTKGFENSAISDKRLFNSERNRDLGNPIVSHQFLPPKRGFKLASLNINSLSVHIDELRILLSDRPIDILAINETKLDDTIGDNEIHISGYESIRRDRSTNGRSGGGVCFFIRSEINYSVRSDLICEQIESLTVEIKKPRSRPFAVMTWYRPPDSSIDLFRPFEELIGKLDSENIEYYVLGDLNCNMAAPKFDKSTNILSNIADVYGLDQLITEHTRITDKSRTLIDLIFTNTPDRVVCSGVSHIGISDHSLVYVFRKVSIESTTNKHTTLRYRKFKNFNSDHFRNDIGQQDWSSIESYSDPNLMWAAWKQLFLECVNKHAPLHVKRARVSKSPWITPYLKKRMHDRDILKLKASRSKDANDWLQFKNAAT
ncbi:uncharacterized protein [Pocillopora verrucosa]|uniref:uncharacterized protein n=1 Tax=Pocillopora verrucosa TaxID=203993 RepID=UPI00333FF88C